MVQLFLYSTIFAFAIAFFVFRLPRTPPGEILRGRTDAPSECRIAFPATSDPPARFEIFPLSPAGPHSQLNVAAAFRERGIVLAIFNPLEGLYIHVARSLATFLSQSYLTLESRFNCSDNYAFQHLH